MGRFFQIKDKVQFLFDHPRPSLSTNCVYIRTKSAPFHKIDTSFSCFILVSVAIF